MLRLSRLAALLLPALLIAGCATTSQQVSTDTYVREQAARSGF